MNFEEQRRLIAALDQKLWPFLFWSDNVISVQDSKMKLKMYIKSIYSRFAKKVHNFPAKIGIKLKFGI